MTKDFQIPSPPPRGTSVQNIRGAWVPAIPLPLFTGLGLRRSRCDCGETFKSQRRYREHYALVHVMGLS